MPWSLLCREKITAVNRHQNMFWVRGGPGPSCGQGHFPIIQFVTGSLKVCKTGKSFSLPPHDFFVFEAFSFVVVVVCKTGLWRISPPHSHTWSIKTSRRNLSLAGNCIQNFSLRRKMKRFLQKVFTSSARNCSSTSRTPGSICVTVFQLASTQCNLCHHFPANRHPVQSVSPFSSAPRKSCQLGYSNVRNKGQPLVGKAFQNLCLTCW